MQDITRILIIFCFEQYISWKFIYIELRGFTTQKELTIGPCVLNVKFLL